MFATYSSIGARKSATTTALLRETKEHYRVLGVANNSYMGEAALPNANETSIREAVTQRGMEGS